MIKRVSQTANFLVTQLIIEEYIHLHISIASGLAGTRWPDHVLSSKDLTKTKVGVQTAFSTHALAVQNIPLLNNGTERLNAVMILHVHNRRLTRSLLWILQMNLLRVVAVTTEKQCLESSLLIYSSTYSCCSILLCAQTLMC